MTYTPLDPSDAVVLFADLQAGIIERAATNNLASLRRAVAALAKLAQLFEIPAIVTTPPGGARVTPEIAAALGALPQHPRTTTDAFTHAPTRDAIVGTGRKTLLIAGVATEVIVQHSALSAAAQGWHVQVVVDACGGLSPRTETRPCAAWRTPAWSPRQSRQSLASSPATSPSRKAGRRWRCCPTWRPRDDVHSAPHFFNRTAARRRPAVQLGSANRDPDGADSEFTATRPRTRLFTVSKKLLFRKSVYRQRAQRVEDRPQDS